MRKEVAIIVPTPAALSMRQPAGAAGAGTRWSATSFVALAAGMIRARFSGFAKKERRIPDEKAPIAEIRDGSAQSSQRSQYGTFLSRAKANPRDGPISAFNASLPKDRARWTVFAAPTLVAGR